MTTQTPPAAPAAPSQNPSPQNPAAAAEAEAKAKALVEGIGMNYDALKKQVTDLESAIKAGDERSAKQLKEMERKVLLISGPERSKRTFSLPGVELEKEQFSFARALKGMVYGDWKGAGFEEAIFKEGRAWKARAMGAGTDTAGGYLVPVQYLQEMIDILRARSVVREAGATILSNLSGSPVEVPKQNGACTAYWIGENTAITASALKFGQIAMQPRAVAAMLKLSKRLIAMASQGVEAIVRNDISKQLALAIDIAALRGDGTAAGGLPGASATGAANSPLGITKVVKGDATGAGVLGTAYPDGFGNLYEGLIDMEGVIEDANALTGPLSLVTAPKVLRKFRKQQVVQYSGQTAATFPGYLFPTGVTNEQLSSQLGVKLLSTTQMPTDLTYGGTSGTAAEIILGVFEEMYLAEWGALELEASTQAGDSTGGAFSSNQVWLKGIMEVDIALRYPEAFCWHYSKTA